MSEATYIRKAGVTSLPLDQITVNLDIQARANTKEHTKVDRTVVVSYREDLDAGAIFPPVVVFKGGDKHWLSDGFHRYEAYTLAGRESIPVTINQGDMRDAILYAVGANADHGTRRTNADKQEAVLILLKDPEWGKWSDREIARQCKVNHELVGRLREKLSGVSARYGNDKSLSVHGKQIERTVTRNDSTYTMKTANIGTKPVPPVASVPTPTPLVDSTPAPVASIPPKEAVPETEPLVASGVIVPIDYSKITFAVPTKYAYEVCEMIRKTWGLNAIFVDGEITVRTHFPWRENQ